LSDCFTVVFRLEEVVVLDRFSVEVLVPNVRLSHKNPQGKLSKLISSLK
jgi:hypothetical protein